MNEPTTSPILKKEDPIIIEGEECGVDFPSAVAFLRNGEKITRIEWGDKNIYGVMKNGFVLLHKADDKLNSWIISQGDVEATDWAMVK